MPVRPIIFSGPMVRAILDGRKTQTRRVLQFQGWPEAIVRRFPEQKAGTEYFAGDTLWVREKWKPHSTFARVPPRDIPISNVFYEADQAYAPSNTPWVPSIHMPRWASRLTLKVTGIKVERVQDISRADVQAEGITEREGLPIADVVTGWHEPFAALWDSINGKKPGRAWADNPWIVAVTFEVIRKNIDSWLYEIGEAATSPPQAA